MIVATFALDGPNHCSGLEVVRCSPGSLHDEFGAGFEIVGSTQEKHHTPFGKEQKFIYSYGLKTSTEENRKGYLGFPTIYEQKSKLTMLEI